MPYGLIGRGTFNSKMKNQLDLKSIPNGLYLLDLKTNKGEFIKKLLKEKMEKDLQEYNNQFQIQEFMN